MAPEEHFGKSDSVIGLTIERIAMRKIIVLVQVLLIFQGIALQAQDNRQHQYGAIYTDCEVDTMATYGGGENELYMFFEQRVIPTHLITGGNENATFFVIMKLNFSRYGQLDSVEFRNSSNVYLENSILKALQEMPIWNPAKKDGIAVPSYVYLPLKFRDAGGYFDVGNSGADVAVVHNRGFSLLKGILLVGAIVIFSKLYFGW